MQSSSANFTPTDQQAHAVQFYTDDEFLLKGLCEFVRTALSEGQSIVLIMTAEHKKGLTKCLRSAGVKVDKAAEKGLFIIVDAVTTLEQFMDGDRPVPKKFFSQIGSLIQDARAVALAQDKPVAAFGEMVAVLWAQRRFTAAIQLERLWNELAKTHDLYLRCAYPASGFEGEMKLPYATICAEHSQVLPGA
jgi:hypothetical protein